MENLLSLINDHGLISTGITFVLGLGGIGVLLAKYAGAVKEVAELMIVVAEAIKDGKVNDSEIAAILKEYEDVKGAIRAIKVRR